jgi:dolichol-phosphate mannosyltransferase
MKAHDNLQTLSSLGQCPEMHPTRAIAAGPELSIIVPTLNERGNLASLVGRLDQSLSDVDWEVIFVDDDSVDGTAGLGRTLAMKDRRVRVIQRLDRRGLSSACVEGMLASSAPFLAVMDGDLQHDETLLAQMLRTIKSDDLDIVIGSRYAEGGSSEAFSASRQHASRFATTLASLVQKAELKDPMSGFFLITRSAFTDVVRRLSGVGFKILLDIFASSERPLRFAELPYTFRPRAAGESKLDAAVAWEYITLLLDKTIGRYVPVRFVSFAAIGAFGVLVHMSVLWTVFLTAEQSFVVGQTAATLVAMTSNFLLNNALTYRDRRLRGWGLLGGWLSFTLACSVGALANVGVANYLFQSGIMGASAWVPSALAGVILGAVWNYAVTSVYTWNRVTRRGL